MHLFIGNKDTAERRRFVQQIEPTSKALAGRMTRFMNDVIVLTPEEERLWESRHKDKQSWLDRPLIPEVYHKADNHNDILQPLIKDEQEAISGYEAAIKRARNSGMNHLGDFLDFIKKQEVNHLDVLRKRMMKED